MATQICVLIYNSISNKLLLIFEFIQFPPSICIQREPGECSKKSMQYITTVFGAVRHPITYFQKEFPYLLGFSPLSLILRMCSYQEADSNLNLLVEHVSNAYEPISSFYPPTMDDLGQVHSSIRSIKTPKPQCKYFCLSLQSSGFTLSC